MILVAQGLPSVLDIYHVLLD